MLGGLGAAGLGAAPTAGNGALSDKPLTPVILGVLSLVDREIQTMAAAESLAAVVFGAALVLLVAEEPAFRLSE